MMLEERTFYLSEMQDGEVWARLPEADSEGWQAEVDERVKAILAREGVAVEKVTFIGAPAGEFLRVRVLVRVQTQQQLLQQLLDTPLPLPDEMLPREHKDDVPEESGEDD